MRLLENFDPIHFSLLSSSDDICDINFVSHDLVLIVLNKGQLLQYQKSGRIVWKTEIPILHVSRVRSQGCATSSATGFYVMTNYGTIYSLCLPYNCSSSPIPTGSAMANRTHWICFEKKINKHCDKNFFSRIQQKSSTIVHHYCLNFRLMFIRTFDKFESSYFMTAFD